jgi:hypothetical protein
MRNWVLCGCSRRTAMWILKSGPRSVTSRVAWQTAALWVRLWTACSCWPQYWSTSFGVWVTSQFQGSDGYSSGNRKRVWLWTGLRDLICYPELKPGTDVGSKAWPVLCPRQLPAAHALSPMDVAYLLLSDWDSWLCGLAQHLWQFSSCQRFLEGQFLNL